MWLPTLPELPVESRLRCSQGVSVDVDSLGSLSLLLISLWLLALHLELRESLLFTVFVTSCVSEDELDGSVVSLLNNLEVSESAESKLIVSGSNTYEVNACNI